MKIKKYLISICALATMIFAVGCSGTNDTTENKDTNVGESLSEDSTVVATSVAVVQILDELGIKLSGIPTTS